MMIREGLSNRIVLWVVTIAGLLVIYAPPLYLLAVSFNPALQPGLPSLSNLSLQWYLALPKETALISALEQSLIIATVTAVLATGMSLLAALAYFELRARRRAWFLTVILPMFVPGVIQGLALSAVFTRAGIKASSMTVIAGHVLWAMPFTFIVILTSFAAVRRSYLVAAADLGATRWRQFIDITLPLIRPGLISAFIFSFLLSLNEFTRAFYLAGRQNTLPVVLFGKMNSGASPVIYAMSGAIFLVSVACVTLIAIRSLIRRSEPATG
ncbi:ABC transporter permease [Rhizobium sp. VS19-DR104.2]|uniref:ABC transporter permease n=1 Tax=unclassified Rhizobium TaxID=2613769 RepID=UPI001CC41C5D|nr:MULTISPECIES: ABC transporter permease [unclassified Rhizobium]MBZ5761209.1 ABC transporter permease [Rhizobium sp. VS19-DR96]MBZ5766963.1 ABC transporter permease [Rhizobium sp. VS19-DR129.2]MBZ5774848.1 ABC transporter permease [Rhizobium sp. VS19-DRK62.2]MBZ5785641.1 ABC transporter permease [Rhizobium sp. VS19-DR121]MBZ5803067.1 ABC transporter permease [Rhizobium sp. VS19-DR181]